MKTPAMASRRVAVAGIVLVIMVGLLNFHVPHFLIESPSPTGDAGVLLELMLLINVVAAVVAAAGIYRDTRWGWALGIAVAGVAILLYVAQETVGLPGLPKMWFEPSRIVSLLVEAVFVVLAAPRLVARRPGADER